MSSFSSNSSCEDLYSCIVLTDGKCLSQSRNSSDDDSSVNSNSSSECAGRGDDVPTFVNYNQTLSEQLAVVVSSSNDSDSNSEQQNGNFNRTICKVERLRVIPHQIDKLSDLYNYNVAFMSAMSCATVFISTVASRMNTTIITTEPKGETITLASVPKSVQVAWLAVRQQEYYFELVSPKFTLIEKHNLLNSIIKALNNTLPDITKLISSGVINWLVDTVCGLSLENEQNRQIISKSLLVLINILSKHDTPTFASIVTLELLQRLVNMVSSDDCVVLVDLKIQCIWLLDKVALCSQDYKHKAINCKAVHALMKILNDDAASADVVAWAVQALVSFTADGTYKAYEPPPTPQSTVTHSSDDQSVVDFLELQSPSELSTTDSVVDHNMETQAVLMEASRAELISFCKVLVATGSSRAIYNSLEFIKEQFTIQGEWAVDIALQEDVPQKLMVLLQSPSVSLTDNKKNRVSQLDCVLTALHVVLAHSNYSQFYQIVNEELLRTLVNLLCDDDRTNITISLTLSIMHILVRDYHVMLFVFNTPVIDAVTKVLKNISPISGLLAYHLLSKLLQVCPPDTDLYQCLITAQCLPNIGMTASVRSFLHHGIIRPTMSVIAHDLLSNSLNSSTGGLKLQMLVHADYPQKLLSFLQSALTQEHIASALCLWNNIMAQHDASEKAFLAHQEGSGVILIKLMCYNDYRVVEQALWAVLTMAREGVIAPLSLLKTDCLGSVLHVFELAENHQQPHQQRQLRLQAGNLLRIMVHADVFETLDTVKTVRPVLNQLLKLVYNTFCGSNLTSELCSALEQIASQCNLEITAEFFALPQLIQCLIRVLTCKVSSMTQLSVLQTLSHLMTDAQPQQQIALLREFDLPATLCTLLSSDNEDVSRLANRCVVLFQTAPVLITDDSVLNLPPPCAVLSTVSMLYQRSNDTSAQSSLCLQLNSILSNLLSSGSKLITVGSLLAVDGLTQSVVQQLNPIVYINNSQQSALTITLLLLTAATVGEAEDLLFIGGNLCGQLALLTNSADITTSATACHCLANICGCSAAYVQAVLDSGVLPLLLHIVDTVLPLSPKHYYIALAVQFALQKADLQQTQLLVDGGVIPSVVSLLLLHVRIPEGRTLVLEALKTLHVLLTKFEHLCDFDCVCSVVESFSGWYYVLQLQNSTDGEVKLAALTVDVSQLRGACARKEAVFTATASVNAGAATFTAVRTSSKRSRDISHEDESPLSETAETAECTQASVSKREVLHHSTSIPRRSTEDESMSTKKKKVEVIDLRDDE